MFYLIIFPKSPILKRKAALVYFLHLFLLALCLALWRWLSAVCRVQGHSHSGASISGSSCTTPSIKPNSPYGEELRPPSHIMYGVRSVGTVQFYRESSARWAIYARGPKYKPKHKLSSWCLGLTTSFLKKLKCSQKKWILSSKRGGEWSKTHFKVKSEENQQRIE